MRLLNNFGSYLNTIFYVTLLSVSGVASAGMHLSLSGSQSTSNAGLQKIESGAGSASLAFDIWDYLRLGYTYRQEISATSGYTETKDANDDTVLDPATGKPLYSKFLNRSRVRSDSVDLTIVLYAGEVFMPYIFVGAGRKSYDIINQVQDKDDEHIKIGLPPMPNGGAGIGIQMSRRFSLKFSHTISMGVKQLPNQEAESCLDSYSQVGISYAL